MLEVGCVGTAGVLDVVCWMWCVGGVLLCGWCWCVESIGVLEVLGCWRW